LTPLLLLLLLLLLITLFLYYIGRGSLGKKGGDADGMGTVDTINTSNIINTDDTSEINSARATDSLHLKTGDPDGRPYGINSPRVADSLHSKTGDRDGRPYDINSPRVADSLRRAEQRRKADSLFTADSVNRADSVRLADSVRVADSIRLADSERSADSSRRVDSLAKHTADSAALRAAICARDTLAPWVYADPSGGLHRRAVSVRLVANKTCRVEWSFDGVKGWKVYDGKPINISKPATVYYRAFDDCGKRMDIRSKRYEFDLTAPRCPAGMELVKAGDKEICVDVYEWPNKKGAAPLAYVSLYQAMDSCFSARKRLCASDEWTAACEGPERWKYTYGESYEWNTCATRDSSAQRSGGRPECRGYYGVFDMSGNLAEWTSTSAPQDKSFNNVMGGFWTSGNQSRCADARYSYYPQNRHNPVGFRCCVDAPAAGGKR